MPADALITGLAWISAAGSAWAVAGLIMALTARRGVPPHHLIAISASVSIAGAALVLIDHDALLARRLPDRLPLLCGILISGGAMVSLGAQSLVRAMRTGHQGTCWTIAQSAMIVPYCLGLVIWAAPHSWIRSAGVVLVLAALVLFGTTRRERTTDDEPATGSAWFWLSLLTFVFFGAQQFLATWPSTWPGWSDPVNIRPMLFYIGFGSAAWIPLLAQRHLPQRRTLPLGLLLGCVGILGQHALFSGLDQLEVVGLANTGFPIGVGISIAGFALLNRLIIREPLHTRQRLGMTLVLGGIVLLGGLLG